MSRDKSIQHGKEHRKEYRKSKAWDHKCRNHGSCSSCENTRTHNAKRRKSESRYECKDCFDTGCVCGGIGMNCDGCCHCATIDNQCNGNCCDRAGEYNGFGSDGPLLFVCFKSCTCHD